METMEIIIYIAIALIVGGLIIAFIAGWDARDTYSSIKRIFSGSSSANADYETVKSNDLPGVVLTFWDSCGFGSVAMQKTVYVNDNVLLDNKLLFDYYKKYNVCKSIQSKLQNCGEREDVTFAGAQGPAILNLACKDNALIITS